MKGILILFATVLLVLPVVLFAQTQSPCAGTVSITDVSQAQPGVLLAVANTMQAGFTISGPANYSGSGAAWAQQNIPAGTYTITWNPVAGCASPPSETKTTDAKGSVIFAGNYTETNPRGWGNIAIAPNPLLFHVTYTFTITGPEGLKTVTSKGSNYYWYSAPSGMYTVTFSPVDGYKTPVPETKTLSPKDSVWFSGEYVPKNDVVLEVASEPNGAAVYINEEYVGKAPVSKKFLRDVPLKIRCSLKGYNDVLIEQRTPEEGIPVEKTSEKCFMQMKAMQQREEIIPSPAAPSYQKNIPAIPQIPPQTQEIETPPQNPPSQSSPKSFFGKVRNTISSFFSRLFSLFSRRPSSQLPIVRPAGHELQGLWKIEKLYTADSRGELKETVLQHTQKERYTEFKENPTIS